MTKLQTDPSPSRRMTHQPLRRGVCGQFAVTALAAGLAVPVLSFGMVGPAPAALALALAGYVGGTILALGLMQRGYPHDQIGLCNLVTLARLALASALMAPLLEPATGWAVFVVALIALTLDGVDGWLARRAGKVSDFGARFDMEVDAALGLILALNAWAAGAVGPVVLLLGLPRYAFIAAGRAWPWIAAPLPERPGRKIVCVIQIATLITLQAPIVQGSVALALVILAIGALVWSFGRDTLWLWRTRS